VINFDKFISFNSREPKISKAIELIEGEPIINAYNKAIVKIIVNNLRNLLDPPKVKS
jgi:hypothetical protein